VPIPMGVGLFVNADRLHDDSPAVAYYDRINGDLKVGTFSAGAWTTVALDGGGPDGTDVGWYPGLAVDADDTLHVTYVDATNDNLMYINTADRAMQVVDDGYRLVGQNDDGLPKPEFHFVGDDSSVVLGDTTPYIAYQDATSHELLLAHRDTQGNWQHETLKGNEDPFVGGYGFYVSGVRSAEQFVISTWVVDQPDSDAWVEVLHETMAVE
jgi:hypothetical protein